MITKINLNALFTNNDVSDFLKQVDDSQHRQLRITSDGIAFISNTVGGEQFDGIAFAFETWIAGNGYVGEAAAQDEKWVGIVSDFLRRNWLEPNPNDPWIVMQSNLISGLGAH